MKTARLSAWLSLFLLLISLLAACGGAGKNPTLESASQGRQVQPTLEEATTQPGLSQVEGLSGTLVLLKGRQLNILPFDDSAPIPIADDVDREQVALSPQQSRLLYNSVSGRNSNVYILDTHAQKGLSLGSSQSVRNLSSAQWSPDETWFINTSSSRGVTLANIDATQTHLLGLLRTTQFWWLTEQKLMWFELSANSADYIGFQSIGIFDLATGESETLDLDLDALEHDPNLQSKNNDLFLQILAERGLELVPSTSAIRYSSFLSDNTQTLEICRSWRILRVDPSTLSAEQVYESPAVYLISEASPFDEARFAFLQWTQPDCKLGVPTVELLIANADGTSQRISDTIFPDFAPSINTTNTQAYRYAHLPNSPYIAWLGGGVAAGYSSLNLYDLDSGQNTVLLYQEKTSTDTDFVEDEMYNGVYWVAN